MICSNIPPSSIRQDQIRLKELLPIEATDIDSNIYIDGNEALSAYCTVGFGTEENPYIIENLTIDTSTVIGMEIKNTNLFLKIMNCNVSKIGAYDLIDGINLNNVSNVVLSNNFILNCYYGINIQNSENITIFNNNCSGNAQGIFMGYTANNTILNNTVNKNHSGIYLLCTNLTLITNNNCSDNRVFGFNIYHPSYNNTIWKNFFCNNLKSQTSCDSKFNTSNQWYYEETGNYYGDYLYWNPSAKNNGIVWDLPYKIGGIAPDVDKYPLFLDIPATWAYNTSINMNTNQDSTTNSEEGVFNIPGYSLPFLIVAFGISSIYGIKKEKRFFSP